MKKYILLFGVIIGFIVFIMTFNLFLKQVILYSVAIKDNTSLYDPIDYFYKISYSGTVSAGSFLFSIVCAIFANKKE